MRLISEGLRRIIFMRSEVAVIVNQKQLQQQRRKPARIKREARERHNHCRPRYRTNQMVRRAGGRFCPLVSRVQVRNHGSTRYDFLPRMYIVRPIFCCVVHA